MHVYMCVESVCVCVWAEILARSSPEDLKCFALAENVKR